MQKKQIIIIFLFIFITTNLFSQRNNMWSRNPHEVFFAAGTDNFLGELGGHDGVGSHSVRDLDFKASRFCFQGGYTFRFAKRWAIGGELSFAMLSGNDKLTNEYYRNNRNLAFRSPLVEFSPLIYFYPMVEEFSITQKLGQRGKAITRPRIFLFTGFSGIWFNPRAQYEGKWYSLRPLGTEGQGIIPTRKKYSRVSFAIPVGFGLDYPLTRNWMIGFEFSFHYAFTDYIDDVSTTYVDPAIFGDNAVAAYFSDPTKLNPSADYPNGFGEQPGSQRGNVRNKDSYMFLSITARHTFGKKYYRPKY
ncbi:MAG: hypothetical protein LBV69_01265 [Bacteroidales bacterium]|jgi:hypothetical protein|nr:hypothetical protein [Bacteroidales bacterium]